MIHYATRKLYIQNDITLNHSSSKNKEISSLVAPGGCFVVHNCMLHGCSITQAAKRRDEEKLHSAIVTAVLLSMADTLEKIVMLDKVCSDGGVAGSPQSPRN
jgi:hypothetical protein